MDRQKQILFLQQQKTRDQEYPQQQNTRYQKEIQQHDQEQNNDVHEHMSIQKMNIGTEEKEYWETKSYLIAIDFH